MELLGSAPVLLPVATVTEAVSLIIGVLGVAGIVFTALRWRRDDTTAVVSQQGELFNEMRGITAELRTDRDELRAALEECVEASDPRHRPAGGHAGT